MPTRIGPEAGSLLVERILVGGLAALIVARVLVASDDPGRLRLTSGGGPLIFDILTFILLLGWSIANAWSKRSLARGPAGFVVLGLLVVAVLIFISTNRPDRYQRPGWFIGWDTVSITVICFLAWQLCISETNRRGIVAVLLATAASIAAQGLYQKTAQSFGLPSSEMDLLPSPAMSLVGDDEFGLHVNPAPPVHDTFRATFDEPDTLASFLLLLLPAALAWAATGWRMTGKSQLVLLIPLLMCPALIFASWDWRPSLGVDNWRSAWSMISQAPIFGIGPGNYARQAGDGLGTPPGYWMATGATIGLIACIVLASVLAGACFFIVRGWPTPARTEELQPLSRKTNWEFYLGGMVGLVLGMMLATGDIPPEANASEILRLGVVSAVRALVWFIAFAILENVSLQGPTLTRSLIAGVALVAFAAIVSNALSSPALQQAFWVAATLALAGWSTRQTTSKTSMPLAWAGAALAMSILAANVIHVALPGLATASKVRSARLASKEFPFLHWQIEGKTGADRAIALREERDYLRHRIIVLLHEAIQSDPDNSALLLERARWGRRRYQNLQQHAEAGNAEVEAKEILRLGAKASRIDPHNLGGLLNTFEALFMIANVSSSPRKEQLDVLEKTIMSIAAQNPKREVGLRYLVVRMLLTQKSPDSLAAWSVHLLRLDAQEDAAHGKMRADQRRDLIERLRKAIAKPSNELATFLYGDYDCDSTE